MRFFKTRGEIFFRSLLWAMAVNHCAGCCMPLRHVIAASQGNGATMIHVLVSM
ncbi:hypothetical protein M758_4G263100 [Ceratodon purpureus]|nr:hypothetical protein M758_4G263100 [Ceratodon purpureus]